jgi:hypothetical protein
MIGEQTFPDVHTLADYLKEEATFAVIGDEPNTISPLQEDYASAFLDMVNWYEIASHADELIESDETDD